MHIILTILLGTVAIIVVVAIIMLVGWIICGIPPFKTISEKDVLEYFWVGSIVVIFIPLFVSLIYRIGLLILAIIGV